MDNSDQTLPVINVVAGILINSQGKILVALRPNHAPQGGLWEFPGGKLERNETPLQALQRELSEEIDIQVSSASIFSTATHCYEDKRILLEAWLVKKYFGHPIGKEGQKIEWLFPHELTQRPFPPANQVIIETLMRGTL